MQICLSLFLEEYIFIFNIDIRLKKNKEAVFPGMNSRNSTEFFDRDFYKSALSFCKSHIRNRGGREDEAEEVLQESFKRFLLKLNERDFQLKYRPKQFLYGIIKNTWKENLRDKKKNSGDAIFREEPADDENTGIQEKIRKETHIEIFERCLLLLSPRCIEALTMQKKGFSLEKMTEILGLSTRGILQDKLYRCRQQLRMKINEDKEYIDLLNER